MAPPTAEGDWHAAGRLRVLLSDDPGHEEAERAWAERHGAEVAVRPRGKRFYGAHEVAVLINLAALAHGGRRGKPVSSGGRPTADPSSEQPWLPTQ